MNERSQYPQPQSPGVILGPQAMIRKTIRIGEVRTSIKLEPEFWSYLKEVADDRAMRLSRLVNEIAHAAPERTNLASTLRTFCLVHANERWQRLACRVEKLTLAGNTDDVERVLEECPLPCLLLSEDRTVRRLNEAFAHWLNVDERGVVGHRLDNMMILRGANMPDLWRRVFAEPPGEGRFTVSYVSPGRVRYGPAIAIGLSGLSGEASARACLVIIDVVEGIMTASSAA